MGAQYILQQKWKEMKKKTIIRNQMHTRTSIWKFIDIIGLKIFEWIRCWEWRWRRRRLWRRHQQQQQENRERSTIQRRPTGNLLARTPLFYLSHRIYIEESLTKKKSDESENYRKALPGCYGVRFGLSGLLFDAISVRMWRSPFTRHQNQNQWNYRDSFWCDIKLLDERE